MGVLTSEFDVPHKHEVHRKCALHKHEVCHQVRFITGCQVPHMVCGSLLVVWWLASVRFLTNVRFLTSTIMIKEKEGINQDSIAKHMKRERNTCLQIACCTLMRGSGISKGSSSRRRPRIELGLQRPSHVVSASSPS